MTFLLLPYFFAASYLSSFASTTPLAWEQSAEHWVALASARSAIRTEVTVPVEFPDLTAAFLAAGQLEDSALTQDIQDLPLNPLQTSPADPVMPSPADTPLAVATEENVIGISVLPPVPSATAEVNNPVDSSVSPNPTTPTAVSHPVTAPATPAPKIVPSPTPSLYIPPRPTVPPIPVSSIPPVVATPATVAVPTPRVPTPTVSYTPAPALPSVSSVPAPASGGTTAIGLRGPIMKAVQSDNLPTYYLTIPRLGLTNVPVNPTDASNDDIWKSTLIKGVGQLLYPPDSGHKTVIFGHSSNYKYVKSNYNEVFKNLSNMKLGDTVTVDFKGKRLSYVVKKTEIVPANTSSIVTDYGREELVLFTCWPYLTSRERFIVYLDRV